MARSACLAAVITCALATGGAGRALAQATQPATPPNAAVPLPALGGASVSVPWPELVALIDRGREAPAKPPVDFVFAAATYAGTVAADAGVNNATVRLTAEADVTVLRDGFVLVPVGPADAGVESATVDGQPAALVPRDGQLQLLLTGAGKKRLAFVLRRPLASDGGASRVTVPFPPGSAINALSLTVPGPNVEAEAGDAMSVAVAPQPDNTAKLTATFRGGANGTITWHPRRAQAVAGDARIYADTVTRASVRRGLVRYQSTVRLSVERGATRTIKVRIDPKALLLSASGKDVSGFAEETVGEGAAAVRTITVTFAGPVTGSREIELVYEKDVPEAGGPTPVVTPAIDGARRDAGVVGVDSDGAYDVRPADGGTLERLGVSELPPTARGAATQLAYRYGTGGGAANVALAPVKAQPAKLMTLTQTRVAVDRGVLRCQARVAYEILHAGVDTLRISLPAGAELIGVEGAGVRDTQVVDEANKRTLTVGLKDVAKREYVLIVNYDVHFQEKPEAAAATQPATRPATQPTGGALTAAVTVPLIGHPDAAVARGFVGVEVRGGYELSAEVTGAERVDVKELPQALWSMARSPLQVGYRYESGSPGVGLSMTRHKDLDVLVAMSDVCEASTTVTPDGRTVTKMMFVMRNNLKPFMTLRLPPGAEVWSTFVDDRPVTPVKTADGRVLVPLKKSEDVEDEDDEGYKAKRDRRRKGEENDARRLVQKQMQARADEEVAADLKPYDVEIVFVTPAVKLGDRGTIETALPQCDVPVGHLAWAVFVPKGLRVVDATGNVAEVARFTLPFRHFGDVEHARAEQMAKAEAMKEFAQAQQKLAQAAEQLGKDAKAVGVLPVRVEIPIVGNINRFEKLLTVDEMPKVTLTYGRKLE